MGRPCSQSLRPAWAGSPCQIGVWTAGPGVADFVDGFDFVEVFVQMIPRGSPAMIAAAAVPRIGPSAGERPRTWAIIAPAYQMA